MKKLAISAAVVFLVSLSSNALALTIDSPGVVGAIGGDALPNANETTEAAAAQHLLDMLAGTSDPSGCSLANACYQTSSTEYSGTLSTVGTNSSQGAYQVPAGYEYVLAKYDGDNAGYVLFYVGGAATDLPEYSYSIWNVVNGQGDPVEASYQISHYVGFNCEGCTSVPDGGTTVTLLGSALFALGVLARKISNS